VKRLILAVILAVAATSVAACGSADYTDQAGGCHHLVPVSSQDASGTVYNGVRDVPCPTTTTPVTTSPTTTVPPVTTTTTVPPVTTTTTVPPVTTTTTVPPTTTTTTTPPVAGYPNASNTGVPAGVALTTVSGNVTAGAGMVIDGKRITGGLTITGNGVVIRNSEIYGTVSNGSGHYSFTVTDSTVGAPTGCNGNVALQFDQYSATRVKVRGFGDAFRGSSAGGVSNILIQDSYALLCSNPGDHSDGYQGYQAGSNVRLIHNTIDQRQAADVTAPIFNADGSKALYADNNLLAGGSFTVRIYDDAGQHSTFTNNKIVANSALYGPVSSSCSSITWSGNTLVTVDSGYAATSTVGPLACAG